MLVLILILATVLRLFDLGSDPLWVDEDGHLKAALAPSLPALLSEVKTHAAAAPLDYLLLRFYLQSTGAHELFAVQLPYVVYGVLTVLVVFLLGSYLYDPATGLVSAFVLAVSAFHIYYSQELRFYALSALLGSLATLAFVAALRRPGWRRWVTWSFAVLLGLYTHYFLFFPLVIQIGWLTLLAFKREISLADLGKAALCLSIAIILFLPWYIWAGNAQIEAALQFGIPLLPSFASFLVALGPGLLFLAFSSLGLFAKTESWLLLALCFLPFLAVFLADNWSGYFFNARQLIFAVPISAVVCSASLVSLVAWSRRALAQRNDPRLRALFAISGFLLLAAFVWTSATQIASYYAAN